MLQNLTKFKNSVELRIGILLNWWTAFQESRSYEGLHTYKVLLIHKSRTLTLNAFFCEANIQCWLKVWSYQCYKIESIEVVKCLKNKRLDYKSCSPFRDIVWKQTFPTFLGTSFSQLQTSASSVIGRRKLCTFWNFLWTTFLALECWNAFPGSQRNQAVNHWIMFQWIKN